MLVTAILTRPIPGAPVTKGKTYDVVDAHEHNGTYTIINDADARMTLGWERFEDTGSARTAWLKSL